MSGSQRNVPVLIGPTVEREVPYGLVGLIRQQSTATPDATALVDTDGSLTYAELESASDRVARALAAAGARPGDVVAVCMPRGTALVVALLGALKAGTPYLPLAMDDPAERLHTLVRDSGARIALVASGSHRFPADTGVPLVDVEHVVRTDASDARPWDPPRPCPDEHPVYVLYTSGSTGRPKGVVVPSLALCNRLLWMCEEYGFGPDDRILQKTPYTFDVSGWEFWAPLISGGRLVLLPPEAHHDPAEIIDWITRHEVTLCHFVPSMLEEFLRWPGVAGCRSLRAVMCSGEALTEGQVQRFRAQLSGTELHNLYGPTEAAIDVTFWPCPRDGEPLDAVLIGRPIANCTLLVVREDLSPVGEGETGQLAIGGQPLALGYLGRPDLTGAAFVDAPAWSPVPRIYLTGDLVRIRGDALEYLGRSDGQVKIRGQRVEPGAVEDVLKECAQVRDAVVVPVHDGHSTQLAAFVVATGITDDEAELFAAVRRSVERRLPPAHQPARYLSIDAVPLTSSGKTDRGRLTRVVAETRPPAAPQQDMDELTRCWAEAVGSAPERSDLGFLQAGGHSLAAVRLAGSVLQRWGVRVPLSEFLRQDLSLDGLRALLPEAPAGSRPDVPRRTDRERAELLPDQRRLWLHRQIHPDSPAYNVVGVLECDGLLDTAALHRSWTRLVETHEVLRTTIEEDGSGRAHQRIHPFTAVGREAGVLRVEQAGDAPWDQCVQEFARTLSDDPFPADRPRRAVLGAVTDAARRRTALVMVVDHLVSDQRSLDLLWGALEEQYTAELSDLPGHDGTAPVQYGDVIAAAGTDPLRRERDTEFWRTTLAGAVPEIALPFQRHPDRPSFLGAAVEEDLGPQLSALIRQLGRYRRVSPPMVVLACYVRVLADWCGQPEVVVGVPVSGRETAQAHDAVGFFMRTMPVRLTTPAEATSDDLLEPVADALLAAADHGSVPFDEIVRAVGGSRDLARNPLFQVWFNDLTQAAPPRSFGGLGARPVMADVRWSLFDLGLYLHLDASGDYRIQLVHATDRWERDVAREFLRQCVTELQTLTLLPPPPSPRPASCGIKAAPELQTCTDLVRQVLGHAAADPGRPAIGSGPDRVTFGELGELIRRSAARIRQCAPPGALVAVLAERRPELPQAVLGAWYAGNPVLLLDGAAPGEWIASAMATADAEILLTLDGATAVPPGLSTLPLDRAALAGVPPTTEAPEDIPIGKPGHALVTSGTTGTPGVVLLPAEALPEALTAYSDALGLDREDRFCFTVPPAHDPMFRDLILPLLLGALVQVPRTEESGGPQALLDLLATSRTTVWHLTPSLARIVTAVAGPDLRLPSVRHVVLHGERLRNADARGLARLCPQARIHNLYGTTETPQASGLALWRDGAEDGAPVAAGLPHRRLAVRTARGEDAAIGVLGELVVTGRGLALGYLGNSERSGPVRVARGRCGEAVSRYRTGDLARRAPDGTIDIVGRRDRQVTVAGYRVELDGVEGALASVHGVRVCAVGMDGPDQAGDLIAWYQDEQPLRPFDVRAALRQRLPRWAVPTRFVRVEQWPVTRNGKVDLAALRTLARSTRENPAVPDDVPASAPSLARRIADRARSLAEERLGTGDGLSPDTEFFRAGLTSLDLLQLYRLLVAEEGLRFPLADVFRFSSARRLAAHLTAAPDRAVPAHAPASHAPLSASGGDERALRKSARARLKQMKRS
ncbi:amino acid adenylation domain-containing protein [Streptomyces sp. AHU1]|uniref:amino acid adenylation domain-containing protein n=1 Tax=Streptomyces sp. AHU1 TaxID=3377215 RepID=UPI0038781239